MYGEFLDTEWYAPWPGPPIPAPEPHTFDPWRADPAGVLLIPRSIVERIVQPERMYFVTRQCADRVEEVALEISLEGLRDPLVILVDDSGRIALKDGHHRTAATRRWPHFELLPARLQITERLRLNGCAHLQPLLVELIQSTVTVGPGPS